ncbi:alpha/beta hydrolase [Trichococcus alkaliphilus]|uniref:alpha/beta hydrolase n=1 Tax=Trichococcus alkaliphilus TaxID=2052943 RepID=UPI000D0BA82D|nr:alpha/beta fold hydrolase [Trichococcus alkaliphilus]
MKNIHFKRKTVKIALISMMLFIGVISIGSMGYVKTNYDESFSRVDKPDPKYSGYLRYSDVADAYERTEITFESGGNALKGYVYGSENDKGLVVISAGLGFGAENYLAETMYFVDNGWRVLTFDNTGTHESEGESTMGPSQSLLDLDAALTFIQGDQRLNNFPVMLYGHSWGGYAVTAILDSGFDIAAVASIGGFNSPMELLNEQVDSLLGAFSPIAYPFLWTYQNILFGNTAWVTATNGINSTDTPVMIIHGVKDEAIAYDGASIIAHRDEIINPNIVYKTSSAENHDGHNNLFESDAASEYAKTKNMEYKEIYDRYDGEIPDEIKEEYYEGVDRFRTSEVDTDFMDEINFFFEEEL